MKEIIVKRTLIYVSNMEKPLVGPLPLKYMKEITLERNLMHVNNLNKPSLI
jgi:hypothetical protein